MKNNKKILNIVTVILYVISMFVYEFGFCNYGFTNHILLKGEDIPFNFSLFRTIAYLIFGIIYGIGISRFLDESLETLKSKSKRITILIYIPFMIAIICYLIIRQKEMYRISLLIITFLMGLVAITYISKNLIKNVAVITLTLGITFACTTRFNGALDEKRHFMSAFNLAAGNINYVKKPLTQYQFNNIGLPSPIQESILLFGEKYNSNIEENTTLEDMNSKPAEYKPIMYLPGAIGIELAKLLKGSVADIYIAGRVTNLLCFALLLMLTLKILPYKEKTFYVVYLLAFSILSAASYSIDGLAVGLVGLFIAYCLNLLNKDIKDINLKEILALIAIFVLMLFVKNFAYIGVGFIVFLLFIIKIIKNNKKSIPIIIMIIAIIALLFGIKLIFNSGVEINSDPRGGDTSLIRQLEFLKEEPSRIIIVGINHIMNTLCNFNWYLVLNPASFFGKYAAVVMFLQFLFILYVSISDNSMKFKVNKIMILLISFLLVYGSTSLILYLTFTEVGKLVIDGYQVRYILPILPLFLITLNNNHETKEDNKEKQLISIISTSFIIINLISMINII